jgi:hypothetical protein
MSSAGNSRRIDLVRRRKRRRRRSRIARIVAIARVIGEHWRTQEGINGALLDELAEATRP